MTRRHRRARTAGVLLGTLALLAGVAPRAAVAASEASEPVSPADRAAIRRVIEDQMAAFKRHDGKAAFAHAAPAIKELFVTPETFMLMVRREYPPLYQPRSFTFGELEVVGGELTQRVTVVGQDGTAATAFYLMSRQDDGSFKILGCILVPVEKTVI